jgi:hypothetical protein
MILDLDAVSIVIAQQYFKCWLLIRYRWNLFTESLPSNKIYSDLAIPAFKRHTTVSYAEHLLCIKQGKLAHMLVLM